MTIKTWNERLDQLSDETIVTSVVLQREMQAEIDALRAKLAELEQEATGPLVNGWQITLSEGHSGYGVYAHMTDYPEDGSVFIAAGVKL